MGCVYAKHSLEISATYFIVNFHRIHLTTLFIFCRWGPLSLTTNVNSQLCVFWIHLRMMDDIPNGGKFGWIQSQKLSEICHENHTFFAPSSSPRAPSQALVSFFHPLVCPPASQYPTLFFLFISSRSFKPNCPWKVPNLQIHLSSNSFSLSHSVHLQPSPALWLEASVFSLLVTNVSNNVTLTDSRAGPWCWEHPSL